MRIFIIILLMFILVINASGQIKPFGIERAKIDSILSRYHLEGAKIFIKKLGHISIKEKKIALERNDINNKLKICVEKTLSLSESGFGAKIDYLVKSHLIIRGETFYRSWGQQSGVSVLFRFEY